MQSYPVARSLLTEQLKNYIPKEQSTPIFFTAKKIAHETLNMISRSNPIDIPNVELSQKNHSYTSRFFNSPFSSCDSSSDYSSFNSSYESLGLSK